MSLHQNTENPSHFRTLLIGCIGVVYGDIGTSPLYAFREAAHHIAEDGVTNYEVLGILSLILWALTITVTIKYVLFLLRADNDGEGGILSLMALTRKTIGNQMGLVFFAGVRAQLCFLRSFNYARYLRFVRRRRNGTYNPCFFKICSAHCHGHHHRHF